MKEKNDIEGLIKELKNKDPRVRTEAVKALVELKYVAALIKALNSDNAEMRIVVAEALKNINDPEVVDALNKTLLKAISSESVIEDALSEAREEEDPAFRLFDLSDICKALSNAGEIERALDVAREIDALRQFDINPEGVDGERASILSYVSKALAETGETERATRMVEEALRITKQISDRGILERPLSDISTALVKLGETERALDVARALGYEFRASALAEISETLIKEGKIENARDIIKEAQDIVRLISSEYCRVIPLSDIAVALAQGGDLQKAKEVIGQALSIAEGIHDRTEYDTSHWFALSEVIKALARMGDTEKALDVARGIRFDRARIDALSNISEALINEGKIEKAKEVIREAWIMAKGYTAHWIYSRALSKIYVVLRSLEAHGNQEEARRKCL
jgi:tetratricopeptide (TPR) repeat protein